MIRCNLLDREAGMDAAGSAEEVSGGERCLFAAIGSVWLVTCHRNLPRSASRARPKEGTDDEANDTSRRADF